MSQGHLKGSGPSWVNFDIDKCQVPQCPSSPCSHKSDRLLLFFKPNLLGVGEHLRVCFFLQLVQSIRNLVTECLFPSPPLQLISGVQELTWRCVCEHWLSCFYGAGYRTRRRSSFPPRKERGSCCCRPNWSCWSGRGIGDDGWSCPVRGNLWRRSSCRPWCWLHCRGWESTDPQTHWPGHCHLSSRSCSYCH